MADLATCNAVNAAVSAAANEIYEFAAQFTRRDDYLPLERLAERVQRRAVEAAIAELARDESRPTAA